MGDSVTVYYTLENGVLRLTDKRLADVNGSDGAVLYPEDETEPGTVTLSKEDIAVRADMATALLTPGLDMKGSVEITARFLPRGKDYPTDHFTAELIYAETLRERNYSFFIKKPIEQTEHGQWIALVPRVPTDAPLGSYDLRITDTDTGFEWVFANMALVVPPEDHPEGEKYPSRESFICEAEAAKPTLSQGEYFDGTVAPVFSVTLISKDGKDVSSLYQAELIYAGDAAKTYGFTVKSSALMSTMPPPYVPVDAPVGMYDLVVTDSVQGHMWRFEDFIEIIEAPDSELMRYGFSYHTETPTVSRSAGHTYYLFAFVENRGGAMNVGEGEYFAPAASMVMQTSNSGFIPVIKLKASPTQNPGPYAYDILRGQKGQMRYELEITPDTHCGVYDLVLSYGDCSKYFLGVIKVVP
jgi:hypothetical protein